MIELNNIDFFTKLLILYDLNVSNYIVTSLIDSNYAVTTLNDSDYIAKMVTT